MSASATSVSAHEWLKNGAPLINTEPILTSSSLFQLIIHLPPIVGPPKEISCTSVKGLGTVGRGGIGEETTIHFANCKTAQAGCDVRSTGSPNGLIIAKNVQTLLVERETFSKTKVLAEELKSNPTTKEFVTLQFLSLTIKSCAESPEVRIKGNVAARVDNPTELFEFPSPELKGNTLEGLGSAVSLFGSVHYMLINGGALAAD